MSNHFASFFCPLLHLSILFKRHEILTICPLYPAFEEVCCILTHSYDIFDI